ncbi:CMP-sialic acid transporter-like [Centruroides vittatus]|uniref:CMP-sialic acid transporter-like n=1 Tax=Centruroides vittatus TaxID=120091 RepID=UPI003510BE20
MLVIMFKVLLLVIMCFNQVAHNLLAAYTRQLSSNPLYFSSTVVFLSETFKLLVSLAMLIHTCRWNWTSLSILLQKEVINKRTEFLKLLIPAALYALQNNLVYISLTNLDPATFQVSTNLKILTTALFMRLILGHRLTTIRFAAIIILFLGIVIVQLQPQHTNSYHGNYLLGISSVLVICICAGFAGVYFEKILKDTDVPFWVKNLEIYIWGILSAGIGLLSQDYHSISKKGFFFGYTPFVWIIIILSSAGGLCASLVMHHLDNILKNFVSSAAIIVTAIGSAAFFHTDLGFSFMLGTFLVCLSIFLYSLPPTASPPSPSNVRKL